MDWTLEITKLAVTAGTAVATAVITVRLALRRFHSVKWWERKSAAYVAIIESLHHLREYADTNLTFAMKGRDLPSEGQAKLIEKLEQATATLRLHRDVGSLVIADGAIDLLNTLFQELDDAARHTSSWHDYLDFRLAAVDKCLPEMRRIARSDLSLREARA